MNLSKFTGATGMGGTAAAAVSKLFWAERESGFAVRSEDEPQMCSSIMEISTCRPHDEHFIVGRNADWRGVRDMSAASLSQVKTSAVAVAESCGQEVQDDGRTARRVLATASGRSGRERQTRELGSLGEVVLGP